MTQLIYLTLATLIFWSCHTSSKLEDTSTCRSHVVDPKQGQLRLYWQGDNGKPLLTFSRLQKHVNQEGEKLRFAMNGGMYLKDHSPQGLYVEKGEIIKKMDTASSGYGNFYMAPNGVFFITQNNKSGVCTTSEYGAKDDIAYATQSGPMLLINGEMHPKFTKGSENIHIRNGVGILPSGEVIFAISKAKINFYDFAKFFESKGCKNALYLDGFVSKVYLPEQKVEQMDGQFGVLIAHLYE